MKAAFNTPFDEQIAFFKAKLNLPTEHWDDIKKSAHDRGFIVAGAQTADLLSDFHGAIAQPISDGRGMEEFRHDFARIVRQNGWTGWTGEGSAAGVAWRTKVIYQTNMTTSYAAGRYKQLTDPEFLQVAPYWRYVHDDSVLSPRPQHAAWGHARLTLPHDHPFWKTHYPPNGWGCQCRVTPVPAPAANDQTAPPDGWDVRGSKGKLPGIDEGFDYAPGANTARPWVGIIGDKLLNLEAPIGAAMWEALQPVLAMEQQLAWWERLQDWLSSPAMGRTFVVGAMSPEDLLWLWQNKQVAPKTSEVLIREGLIRGAKQERHEADGDGLLVNEWRRLPEIIGHPEHVLYDTRTGKLVYVAPSGESAKVKISVEFDMRQGKDGRKNMIVSGFRQSEATISEMIRGKLYEPIR